MCYWGLYQALSMRSPDDPTPAEALKKAVRLEKTCQQSERLYIEAAKAGEASVPRKKLGDGEESDEVRILRKLVKQFPSRPACAHSSCRAVDDGFDEDGNPKKGTKEAPVDVFRPSLKDEPENSAANHYWIHAVSRARIPNKLCTAPRFSAASRPLRPHGPHAGHIFYRTGDYATADKSFAASTVADETYMQAQHVDVDDDWNYVHNLMYAIANLMEEGRLDDATRSPRNSKARAAILRHALYLVAARFDRAHDHVSPSRCVPRIGRAFSKW